MERLRLEILEADSKQRRDEAIEAQAELVKRFTDKSQARLDPCNPYWGLGRA